MMNKKYVFFSLVVFLILTIPMTSFAAYKSVKTPDALVTVLETAEKDEKTGIVKLTNDADISEGEDDYAISGNITLDLNGHTLSTGENFFSAYMEDGKWTIMDSSNTGKGVIKGKQPIRMQEGELIFESGKIEADAAGITFLNPGGKVTINDGEIVGPYGVYIATIENGKEAILNVNGGTLKGNTMVSYGLFVPNDEASVNEGKIEIHINGGEIIGNCTKSDTASAALYVGTNHENVTLNIENAKIEQTGVGYGVLSESGSTEIVSGTIIGGSEEADEKGTYKSTGVCVAGEKSTLTISGGNITGKESGVHVLAKATAEISNADIKGRYGATAFSGGNLKILGGTITGETAGLSVNGADKSNANTTITVSDGTIKGGIAGAYMAAGTLKMTGGEVEGQAGIVVRGSSLEVSDNAKVVSTGNGEIQIGDIDTQIPAAAVVVDKEDSYNDGTNQANINGGEFVAAKGRDAIVYTEEGTEQKETVNGSLVVKGGNFSSKVDEAYLDDSLTAELQKSTGDAPFSYYTSLADANAKKEEGDTTKLLTTGTATLVDFGFKAKGSDANTAIEDSFDKLELGDVEATRWDITDCVEDTMYATFKGTETATDYVVKFYKGTVDNGNIVYESTAEEAKQVTKGCVVYFSFHHQAQPENLVSGAYVVELYKKDTQDETLVSTATLNISKVTFAKAEGDDTEDELPADTFYAQGEEVKLPTLSRSGYIFSGWKDADGKTYKDTYTVSETGADVTLTAKWTKKSSGAGGGGSSATTKYTITVKVGKNGTVSPSGNVKVEEGEDQKFVFSASKGYEVEDVLVDGKSVGAVTSYTFEDVKEKHTLSVTFKKSEEETTTTQRYNDVAQNAWYYDAIEFVSEEGLMQGTATKVFDPELPITRGMMATVLYRLSGANTKKTSKFADVASNSYYTNAIAWATDNGIVTGVGENLFEPDREIKREELATMIARYLKNMKVDIDNSGMDVAYDDATSISDYAKDFVKTMRLTGLMQGKNGNNFDAAGMATRAEVATILMRYVEKTTK